MNIKHYVFICIGIFIFSVRTSLSQQLLTPTSSFLGTHEYERVAYHLHTAGDVNGDGYDDFLVGTFHNKTNGYNAGAAYLILGSQTADWGNDISLLNANARFLGAKPYESAGYFLGGGGDVNDDGLDDFLIGAADGYLYVVLGRASANWGMDFVLYDRADAWYEQENEEDQAGLSVAIIGDMNGDGYDDMICGAPFNDYGGDDAGKAYLILGKASGWQRGVSLSNANASFYGSYGNGLVGYCVDGVGDVNGDNIPDFALGARGEGKVYLFFGRRNVNWGTNCSVSQANVIFSSEQYGNYTGWRVSSAGDVNGDGFDDFLIGAPYHDETDNENGKVYLILGRSSGWHTSLSEADASYYGEDYDDEAGWDTQGAGDVDGDGFNDFLIGAWYNDANGDDSGKMYLIRGKPSGWQRDVSLATIEDYFIGEHAGDYAGYSCSTAGDVNGDGLSDIITSASYYSEAYEWGGKIYVFVSENVQPATITVVSPNGGENWNVSSIHNINWNSENTSGTVKLEYSTNNGANWKQIIASTEDDGTHSWTVPDDPSTNCLVRVTDTDGDPSDVSDAVFTISPISYTLTMAVNAAGGGTTEPTVGGHSYSENTVVDISATANLGYDFVNWTGDVADPNSPTTTVTMDGNKTVTANFTLIPIVDSKASIAGENILLEWSPSLATTIYNVYRDTLYNFEPDTVNGTNRIGYHVSDEDPATDGVQWTDTGNGAQIVGDVDKNYFYKVTAVADVESAPSSIMGEFDYRLITTSTTDINEVVVIMNTQNGRNPILTAEDLINAIPYCSDAYYWNASGQGTVGHPKGVPFNNFTIYPGYPYIVNVTENTVWTVAGTYSDTSFQLITTDITDINHLAVPLSKDMLTTAEELGQDIPHCSDVYYWNAEGQGTTGHVMGLPFNNFAVRAGYPYYVNVTSATVWPSSGEGSQLVSSMTASGITVNNTKSHVGLGVAHTVYGTLSYATELNQAGMDWTVKAWIIGRANEILSDDRAGSGCDGEYWWIGVSDFATAWQVGDSLMVEISDKAGKYRGETMVVLTDAGSDNAGEMVLIEATSVSDVTSLQLPKQFVLHQNYPNPFNPETMISFQLPESRHVILKIYNLLGDEICTLINENREAGYHQVIWNGKNKLGQQMPSGIYFFKIKASDFQMNRKMVKVQ